MTSEPREPHASHANEDRVPQVPRASGPGMASQRRLGASGRGPRGHVFVRRVEIWIFRLGIRTSDVVPSSRSVATAKRAPYVQRAEDTAHPCTLGGGSCRSPALTVRLPPWQSVGSLRPTLAAHHRSHSK
jgi:hypothetical protein